MICTGIFAHTGVIHFCVIFHNKVFCECSHAPFDVIYLSFIYVYIHTSYSAIKHCVPLAGFCLSLYDMHALNRDVNMIQSINLQLIVYLLECIYLSHGTYQIKMKITSSKLKYYISKITSLTDVYSNMPISLSDMFIF